MVEVVGVPRGPPSTVAPTMDLLESQNYLDLNVRIRREGVAIHNAENFDWYEKVA